MIFVPGNCEYAIPLSFEDEPGRVYLVSDLSELSVGILRRLSHARKLREAKQTLWVNNIPRRIKWKGEA